MSPLLAGKVALVVEVNDGTAEYNATRYRVSFFYDLAKAAVNRMAFALAHELRPYGATAVALTEVQDTGKPADVTGYR